MAHGRQEIFPEALIACIAAGRDPTVQELFALAERVWIDGGAARSVFGWHELPPAHVERLQSIRTARIALSGNADRIASATASERGPPRRPCSFGRS